MCRTPYWESANHIDYREICSSPESYQRIVCQTSVRSPRSLQRRTSHPSWFAMAKWKSDEQGYGRTWSKGWIWGKQCLEEFSTASINITLSRQSHSSSIMQRFNIARRRWILKVVRQCGVGTWWNGKQTIGRLPLNLSVTPRRLHQAASS